MTAARTMESVLPSLLVVSDDHEIRSSIERAIGYRFRMSTGATSSEVDHRLQAVPPDLVIVDVPSSSCWQLELVERIRQSTSTPCMVLGRQHTDALCVMSLRLGADDFVPHDVEPDVLAARVHALLRRSTATTKQDVVYAAGLVINFAARSVTLDGELLHLTPIEFDLLAYLAKHPRRALGRDLLLAAVWGSEPKWQGIATVTEHVRRLRLKLGSSDGVIATVYGIGYRFDPAFVPNMSAAAGS